MTTTTVTTTTKNPTDDMLVECYLSYESVVEELKQQQKRLRPARKSDFERKIRSCRNERKGLSREDPSTYSVGLPEEYWSKPNMTVDNDCFLSFESVVAELVSIRMEQISDEWDRSWDRSWDRNSDDGDY